MESDEYLAFRQAVKESGLESMVRRRDLDMVRNSALLTQAEQARMLKNANAGLMVAESRKYVQGYFAGTRDFLRKGRSLESVKDQFITLVHNDGTIQDYQIDFKPRMKPWAMIGLDVTFGWRQLRTGGRIAVRQVNKIVGGSPDLESVLEQVEFLNPDELNPSHKHTMVAVKGAVVGVLMEPNWIGDGGYFPYDEGEWPTCEVHLRGSKVRVFVHFGPYNRSFPLINHSSFSLDKAPTVKEMDLLLLYTEVGIIGSVRAVKKPRQHGKPMTDIHITATAILDLEAYTHDQRRD